MKPSTFWPTVIAGALGLHVLAMLAMVSFATSNESYTVEPDYYRKGLAWNEKQAQDRRNIELGWTLGFVVEPAAPGNDPVLRVRLTGAAGSPLNDAEIAVEAFSNVRRDHVLNATLDPADDGYETTLPMQGNGLWEFRFIATRGDDVFTSADTRHIWTKVLH